MGGVKKHPKKVTPFVKLGDDLGTYNKWCNRVKKLNYLGNLELLKSSSKIGVMGGRKLSIYGKRIIGVLITPLTKSKDLVLVTGDLIGVERAILKIAKENGMKVILVTGSAD